MEMLFYLVVIPTDGKSLLYTEMESKELTRFLLISIVEVVISIMGLHSSVFLFFVSMNANFAE